jgi:hypothetical protein
LATTFCDFLKIPFLQPLGRESVSEWDYDTKSNFQKVHSYFVQ